MRYATEEAKDLTRLLDGYEATKQNPTAWLKATTDLVAFASKLREKEPGDWVVVRAFEIGLVLRLRAATFRAIDPLAGVVWQLLYAQALDSRAAAGEAAEYVAAVLRAVGAEQFESRSPYALIADLACHALKLMGDEDDAKLDGLPPEEAAKARPSFQAGRDFFAAVARLLALNNHPVPQGLQVVARGRRHYSPLTDLVYYDWGWGVAAGDNRFRPADPDTSAEPNRPLAAPGVVWRNGGGQTVGSPLRAGGRIALHRFNVDVLLNLAVWKAGREAAKKPADDLTALWNELASGEKPACKFGTQLDPVDSEPLADVSPHANYTVPETDSKEVAERWQETKAEWLRRKDVIREGYAIRYWAANNSFLNYLFRSWGWVAVTPEAKLNLPDTSIPHDWPVVPTLAWFAQKPNLSPGDRAVLARWWNTLTQPDRQPRAPEDGGPYEKFSPWHSCKASWVTIGAKNSGKTWLDLAVLHGTEAIRDVGGGVNLSRGAGGLQYTQGLLAMWRNNVRVENEAELFAELILTSGGMLGTQLALQIKDSPGEDYNLDRLFQGGNPTDVFTEVVAPRLKEAGAVSVVIDCERFLTDGADAWAERECLLLEVCDKERNTGLPDTPIAVVLSKADRLGLTEPLGPIASLLARSLPAELYDRARKANDPKAAKAAEEAAKAWVASYLNRPETSRQLAVQFVGHRVRTRLWRLTHRAIRGPVDGRPVDRLVGVFLTCGLYQAVQQPSGSLTGAGAYLGWVAQHVMRRWLATVSGQFASQLWAGIGAVLRVVRPQRDQIVANKDKFESNIPRWRRGGYNEAIAVLNPELGNQFPQAEAISTLLANLIGAQAAVARFVALVEVYEEAARGIVKHFPNRQFPEWR